jgi:hypothetical protein
VAGDQIRNVSTPREPASGKPPVGMDEVGARVPDRLPYRMAERQEKAHETQRGGR